MKTQRNLDGVYYRTYRNGEWCNVCYSDLEQSERDEIASELAENKALKGQVAYWRTMADILADALYDMGEHFGIIME